MSSHSLILFPHIVSTLFSCPLRCASSTSASISTVHKDVMYTYPSKKHSKQPPLLVFICIRYQRTLITRSPSSSSDESVVGSEDEALFRTMLEKMAESDRAVRITDGCLCYRPSAVHDSRHAPVSFPWHCPPLHCLPLPRSAVVIHSSSPHVCTPCAVDVSCFLSLSMTVCPFMCLFH